MKRDFEKARRRDLAKNNYNPIDSFKPWVGKRKKHRTHRHNKFRNPPPPPKPSPTIERTLSIEAGNEVWLSRWRRTHGHWRCVSADDRIEWFLRVRNPEVVDAWLFKHHYPFKWHKATPACQARPRQAEDNPADSYTLNQASALQKDNTVTSKNNNNPDDLRGPMPQSTSGLVPTGLTTPCGLIRPSTNTQAP